MPLAKQKRALLPPIAVCTALVFAGAVLAGVLLHRRHRPADKGV